MTVKTFEEIVRNRLLPTQIEPIPGDQWPRLTDLGFVKGEPVPGDDLFTYATLPDGWTYQEIRYSYTSYLLDERLVRRVALHNRLHLFPRVAYMIILNVGEALAADAIYNDGPAMLPDEWSKLTDDELSAFRGALDSYRESSLRNPRVYGNLLPRVDALTALANGPTP
ncbi:MAG: hypothetical protein U5O16_23470 [Rhodococcus sp. (in: high G+C Gram-positive bacteria)]|uniref:hypothetical protein n=1 Tax=Rhodococcus sp. TaxID=1831 RepID=UPI002ADB738B|nr:hypothetical protein [Rhodococcus sp. (in: high G+C Gram-positive bacteria)]